MTPDQIKQLVLAAYEEGFCDGSDHGNLDWKYPPCVIAWLQSQARKDAGFPLHTKAQQASLNVWSTTRQIEQRRALTFDGVEP